MGTNVADSKPMAATHPELAAQWHPTLNGALSPTDVVAGSGRKFWWQCNVADDHVWEAQGSKRAAGQGCPFCSSQRVAESNCMATTHPELAAQWHPILNGEITPHDVMASTNRKYWWQCDVADDHVWDAQGNKLVSGRGCPFCAGKRVAESNCMATTHPELAAQWHPTLNGEITAHDVAPKSNKLAWWKCDAANDHVWQASIASRSDGRGCPFCSNRRVCESNCMATTHPHIASQLHPTLNGDITAHNIVAGTGKKLWWRCFVHENHAWQRSGSSRVQHQGSGCPYC